MTEAAPCILLTGATGYVGGRLRRQLEERGARLRCVARRPEWLRERVAATTEVVEGDLLDRESVRAALAGVDVAYYLVHSMGGREDFAEMDRRAAEQFAEAAAEAGVRRIIYLGGLGHGPDLSPHLASRQEVGRILREGPVPALEFRSSIIIGSGSLSFELIRALVERLPVMTIPSWVSRKTQPVAIEDVVAYLLQALDRSPVRGEIVEIGGPDLVSYRDLMEEYARQRGLRRRYVPLPVLSTRVSSLWLGLVTPIYARIGRDLIEGVRNETIVQDPAPARTFDVQPRGVAAAIARALSNEDRRIAETRWCDAFSSKREPAIRKTREVGTRIIDSRALRVRADPASAFTPIRRIGGRVGWYWGNWLWRLRGFLDLLVGGVGVRRGRRDPEHVQPGDALDFWRVDAYEPDRLLRLRAEMKVPGRAWLQFEVEPEDDGCSEVRQTALFDPRGLRGRIYWYGLYPLHLFVFAGMLREIGRRGEEIAAARRTAGKGESST